jgi:hypothetical protein
MLADDFLLVLLVGGFIITVAYLRAELLQNRRR